MTEHNLIQIVNQLNTHLGKKAVPHANLNSFDEMNRLARYPFASIASLHSQLHIHLLKAEILREHPDIHTQGFCHNTSSLNYMDMPSGNHTADDLLRSWSSISNRFPGSKKLFYLFIVESVEKIFLLH